MFRVSKDRAASLIEAAVIILGVALFLSLTAKDIPLLRHDWVRPYQNLPLALQAIGGWNPTGLGAPTAYPSSYLVVPVMGLIGGTAGPYVEHVGLQLAIAVMIVTGARRLASVVGGPPLARAASSLTALFNPWVYTETVAGHSFMLLSWGATLWVAASLCERTPARRTFLALAFVLTQIQFFVLAFLACLYELVYKRSARPLALWCLLALPLAISVVSSRSQLGGLPLTLDWERDQSIPFSPVWRLSGYFTGYDGRLPSWISIAMYAIVALAAIGLLCAPKDRRVLGFAFVSIVAAIAASGLRGPLAPLADFVFRTVPASILFRELFDVVAFVAMGYLGMAACATSRWRHLSMVWLIASSALAAGWAMAPPLEFAVPASRIPITSWSAVAPQSRFALSPAFQPMSLHGEGSGLDPDAHDLDPERIVINEAFPSYPVVSVLAAWTLHGQLDGLRALGVQTTIARPWLQTDTESLRSQRVQHISHVPVESDSSGRGAVIPMMSILPGRPQVGTIMQRLGGGNVLFSDVNNVTWSAQAIKVPRTTLDPRNGWVDIRLTYETHPEFAQPFGGVITESRKSLKVARGEHVLAWVQGSLFDGGQLLASSTGSYRWLGPEFSGSLRCEGTCVVAATGFPPQAPENPAPRRFSTLAQHALCSWLVITTVPASAAATLRYNVAYDNHWIAVGPGWRVLQHVRLDGVINGWIVTSSQRGDRIVLVEWSAGCVAASELFVACVLLVLLTRSILEKGRRFLLVARLRLRHNHVPE